MTETPSTDSLYLDSDVARENRMQAEAEMEANAMEANAAANRPDEREGLLGGVKNKFDSTTTATGSSVSEFGNTISDIAQEKASAAKDIIMNTAVPAAQGALSTVQGHVRSISGGGKGFEETVAQDSVPTSREDDELIDSMSDEQVCDFLRDKHMSNKLPPRTD
ncbi:hypothetical protein N7535_005661 [Penicillium sp. DV-2018c]|nr:hypothetical protein N7461_009234 [Penicillium sp. DV-2018c]KAJ5572001.1 hypothetical protein N7535_005661 [Penicillium sp. DV-2018c]